MQAAVHLPQVPFAGPATELPARARDVVDAAGDLGFVAVSANDHFTFSTQWVDGLMLLASIAERAGPLELMTTVALPALRGPVAFASSITALAAMSKGRVVAGVGPGSSAADHGLAGLDWSRRWQRYDETLQVLRSLLGGDGVPAGLRFYAPADQPTAVLTDVPHVQLWPASWGSEAGLRRVAAHGEGWLASAYHTSPDEFGLARTRLEAALRRRGADPGGFGHAVVTMWTYVSDRPETTRRILADVLAPALGRAPDALRGRLCVGSPAECTRLVGAYAAQGCRRMHFWPIADEVEQLELLAHHVLPGVVQ